MRGMSGLSFAVGLLSDAEIARRLSSLQRSRGHGRVPVASVARHLGLSRPTIYKYLRGRIPARKPARRYWLSVFLLDLERKALAFERKGQSWRKVRRTPPDPLPPPQDKIVRADEWNEWAHCRTCDCNNWLPAYHFSKALMVCASCIPLGQFPYLGFSSSPPQVAK